eukprot:scaffold10087_cov166-Amphora_coffeaeformis.AAC.1
MISDAVVAAAEEEAVLVVTIGALLRNIGTINVEDEGGTIAEMKGVKPMIAVDRGDEDIGDV